MNDADTDTLIAMATSLLTVPYPGQDIVLDTLVQCNGDVQATAALIDAKYAKVENNGLKTAGAKRKAPSSDLSDWLASSNPSKPPSIKKHAADASVDRDSGQANAARLKSNLLEPATKILTTLSDVDHPVPPESVSQAEPVALALVPLAIKDTTHVAGSSPRKPAADLMGVLRPPPSATWKPSVPRLPPLTLSSPSMVAQHTPCTLHLSVLPPELACELFYTMIDLSRSWKRNKWWLFDRIVESPHRTSFFVRRTNGMDDKDSRQEAAQCWYNGRPTEPPEFFPEIMEKACKYVENTVNEEIRKRERLPLEWAGSGGANGLLWHANVAASNCYEGAQENVGFHSDQLTYLGPYPTIASLSLGTTRIFRLREVIPSDEIHTRSTRTFNISLPHNSLTIMHAKCQESFKHSIPPQSSLDLFRPLYPHPARSSTPPEPSNCRINITFRFYRPDFEPKSTPRCKCGVPAILRADMKHRHDGQTDRHWWVCYAGAQNDGKGCDFWRVMDMQAEGRGPFFTNPG